MKYKKIFVGINDIGLFLFLEDVMSFQELFIFLGTIFQALFLFIISVLHIL
jgi:hypothetical protein